MKALLIDDEYYALESLRMALDEIGGIEIVGMFQEAEDALAQLERLKPNVLFMDIEMPGMSGLEIFESLSTLAEAPTVVFVTAYSEYAVQAYELDALDYLVKPVRAERLHKTLHRINRLRHQADSEKKLFIKCFKRFSLISNGVDISTGWRTRKSEELIAYLACRNGEFVSKERIAEELWPEQERGKALNNLYLAHYYLREFEKRNGVRIPIESERSKMRLCVEAVDCDLTAVDRALRRLKHSGGEERAKLLDEIRMLYSGLLLEENYYEWVTDLQYRYDNAVESLLETV